GLNKSRLNAPPERRYTPLGDEALFGKALADKLNEKLTRQFRIGFLVEQTPDLDNRVTLSREFKDGLGLDRPEISYNLSDYTRQVFVATYRIRNLLCERMYVDELTQ